MAIDSQLKRMSAISPRLPWRGIWPIPDGAISASDRMVGVYLYGGIGTATTTDYGGVTVLDELVDDVTITDELVDDVTILDTLGSTGETPVAYDIGDRVNLAASFVNSAGTATDPTTIVLVIQRPDESEISVSYAASEITKDSTGEYHYYLTITQEGTWYYRYVGTGAVIAAEESSFEVTESVF